jgi:hypothetical protein
VDEADAARLLGVEALPGDGVAARMRRPIACTMCVEIGVGATPTRTSVMPKDAAVVASATSTQQAMPVPPPKQAPWMSAKLGFGNSFSRCMARVVSMDAASASSGGAPAASVSQAMSAPAWKCRPAPRITSARMPGSAARRPSPSISASSISPL